MTTRFTFRVRRAAGGIIVSGSARIQASSWEDMVAFVARAAKLELRVDICSMTPPMADFFYKGERVFVSISPAPEQFIGKM